MTVGQLVEILRGLDPDVQVWRDGGHRDYDVKATEVDYVGPTDPEGRCYIGIGRVIIR